MRLPMVLVAETEETLSRRLRPILVRDGYETARVSTMRALLQSINEAIPALVVLSLPKGQDVAWLEAARTAALSRKHVPFIVVTAGSSEELAIAALRAGATDYFKDPGLTDEIVASVRQRLPRRPAAEPSDEGMIGQSASMLAIKACIRRVATTDSSVLITGETGTGKELVAALVHGSSHRRNCPFVAINCAAVPDTLLESELFGYERGAFTGAHAAQDGRLRSGSGGSVFFDEIGDMSIQAQAKILRVIETKEVQRLGSHRPLSLDVRVIAATNRDLERLIEEGAFRRDLYFRLNVATIHLPPLRERREDIPRLIEHYLSDFNRRFGRQVESFTDEAMDCLLRYDWPGNVRELKNLLEVIFVNLPAQPVTDVDLPESFRRRLHDAAGLPQDERARLLSALFATRWNKSRTAQQLHWSRMTVYRKMAKYGLTEPVSR